MHLSCAHLLGGACFSHGPYTFYKAVRIGDGRVLRLGNFFLTKLWNDADLVSIGELQLLWLDSRGPNQPLASLRLYFLPENTPDGRRDTHGEDEVLTISEKVVVRVNDLVTWLSPSLEWSWGREVVSPPGSTTSSSRETSPRKEDNAPLPQVLTDPGIDFSDVEKQQKEYESSLYGNLGKNPVDEQPAQTRVVVLSYPRYCRYRALLRRLEGAEPSWLCSPVAAALGGFTALPGTRVLFCRDTFDYPDLETHELLCNHLAPKLKGRPRRKRKKRSTSPGESSNESEASVASTSKTVSASIVPGLRPPSSGVRRSERKASGEEKRFISDVQTFMNSRGTPVGKMPLLGYKQIDLFLFYTKVRNLGGYESVSAGRLWKSIYDEIGGNTGSTSAATITRRHYERLLLPFERHQRGEEIKIRPAHGRRSKTGSMSEEAEVKQESELPSPSQTTQTYTTTTSTPTSPTDTPPLQSILSTPILPGEKPKAEVGKISSLRSVRVKPERLKSLNTIIANTVTPSSQSSQLPSPPPSSNTPVTTPTTPPPTTPNDGQSVLERQLNSPLIFHQVPSSPTPPSLPVTNVNSANTNATAVVTLTPPPEKDIKELKLDPKQTSLLAQGKENIPVFGEKTIVSPRSPEVIDLETETDSSRDKIIIPSLKKRKLEILREGGLEVTAVDLESRPSVIQATITPVVVHNPTIKPIEEKTVNAIANPIVNNSSTKLISVTVTPDISHMLPSPQDNQSSQPCVHTPHQQQHQYQQLQSQLLHQQQQIHPQLQQQQQQPPKQPTNNNTSMSNNNVVNSRVINLGSSNNSTLLQLYANANVTPSNSNGHIFAGQQPPNGRIPPPKVTQSRSIFSHSEKMVYGNPKEILMPNKYQPVPVMLPQNNVVNNSSDVLDLTRRAQEKPAFSRPSLEIVRVPIVPRPNPLNLDIKNTEKVQLETPKKTINYPNMLDSRTMVSNNLEITLVNPSQQKSQPAVTQQQQQHQHISQQIQHVKNSISPQHRRQQHVNGKYPLRNEAVSPYTPRKPNHMVIPKIPNIPNVPSLNHLNNIANTPYARNTLQQLVADRRKSEAPKEHCRINESERCMIGQQQPQPQTQQQQHQQQQQQQEQCERQGEAQQRHSASNFHPLPPMPPNSAFLSQLPNHGKFLPMLDPMYYSALYNGVFPLPIHPSATFFPPELSAYYKEFLDQPARLAMAGQPTVPTSK
ncbi:formin-J isoform X1 [Neodiprion lecontei]|uniref:Formin-J isoform X1 n=1 Tax=Neodiprion lecontei TaxID=441921 RepID=A0ABM3GG16_NEOLC|nr:formin-J isoform X1 [Neodiprion lecontei]